MSTGYGMKYVTNKYMNSLLMWGFEDIKYIAIIDAVQLHLFKSNYNHTSNLMLGIHNDSWNHSASRENILIG